MSVACLAPALVDNDLLDAYATFSATLGLSDSAVGLRRRLARQFVAAHPDLDAWMAGPLPARLGDLRRTKAWPLVSWAVLSGRLRADIDLLVGRHLGGMHRCAEALHPGEFAFVGEAALRLGWRPGWVSTVMAEALTLVVAFTGRSPRQLTSADVDAVATAVEASQAATPAGRLRWRRSLQRLRKVLFEAGVVDQPAPSARARLGPAGQLAQVGAAEVRRAMLAYLDARAAVLRPATIVGIGNDLASFGEFLTEHDPDLACLAGLERRHVEGFFAWLPRRCRRGHLAGGDRPVSVVSVSRAVITLRTFLEDITAWGWADAPGRQLIYAADIPRLPKPLPRALPPDVDRAVMAAVSGLDDPFARAGLTIVRGTGLRVGELVDLEMDCVVDYGTSGTWLRVPLGKLATERSVPLDDPTLAAFDDWMGHRGRHRSLPHPRHGRPVDFLFVEHGQRLATPRLRRGLERAVRQTGFAGAGGDPLRVTPHQLRHTYATSLANGGMSLQGLMILLGHRSPEMTMRYATLASPTLRTAYDEAIGKLRPRIPVAPSGRAPVPDKVDWLRQEMLKTRVAHGYCSRDLVADACPYANICEQCENFVTTAEFQPAIEQQLADVRSLEQDANARGWESESARHARVIDSLERHLRRITNSGGSATIA
ncbi:MAG: tyrosine-type recombinase/integrase [Acidimicrobiales bacterium]